MENIKLTINGQEISTIPGKTILEVVNENKLDEIPTLCHDDRLEHFTSCFLCVVEVEGMNRLVPSCSTIAAAGMKIQTHSDTVIDTRKTALELLMSNHYADCIGPCKNGCPAGVDAQAYIALISMGKYTEALKLVKQNNPLPLSISRVCVRDCEAACRRNKVDDPVAVNAMKRFIADLDITDKWTPHVKNTNGRKVAVIGGGPAGLSCSYYLRLEGFEVTIFEKFPKLGGMLRYGIPEYRLPKAVLDSEIQWIIDLGIEVRTQKELGRDYSIHGLLNEGYESVFIGVGAHKASKMGLAGEDITEGIFRGIDFLREVELGNVPRLKGIVIIVGGGNTAIDAARTAVRCGADKVKIVYRRSINEMPAHPEEIEAAQKEGVEINFLTNPKSLITENKILKGIECLKMVLVEGKPGERPKPVPQEGSEFIIECDYLISAIGQAVDTSFAKMDSDCMLEKWGTVCVNKETFETNIPGVFAGGDAVTGPFTAITSIAQGKKAAVSIMNYLRTGRAKNGNGKYYSLKHKLSEPAAKEFDTFKKLARQKMNELEMTERVCSFEEVEKGFSEDQVLSEAERCLECGCSEYYDCKLRKYADEYHLDIGNYIGETKKYKADRRHPFISLDPNKCINCGKCVRTCSEILKVSALGFVYRGFKSVVKPSMKKALSETNCISCGNCIDACPTGAISQKLPFKILGTLPKDNIETVCSFCSIGCKVNFKKISNDIFYISNATDEITNSHNKGYLCTKGRFGHNYLLNKHRVLLPQIKENGNINYTSLDNAVEYTVTRLKKIIQRYGNDSVAVLASPKLSNEELYLLQKFARTGLGNNNISSFSHLNHKDKNTLDDMTGLTASSMTMEETVNADVIIVMNSNLSEDNLVMELKLKEAAKRGAFIVLMNSSEIRMTKYADIWIDSKKGTNTYLLDSVAKEIIDSEAVNESFISAHMENFPEYKKFIASAELDKAVIYSSVSRQKIESLISLLSDAEKNVALIYNYDSTTDKSVNDLRAGVNLMLLTGRIGKMNNGILLLREHNNSTGAFAFGSVPEYLPGYVKDYDKEKIEKIGKEWNKDLTIILDQNDLAKKLHKGDIKAVLIFGEDPLNAHGMEMYFNGIEFMAVMDAWHTATTLEADVLLPAASYIEQEGTYTRCDNIVQKAVSVIDGIHIYNNWQIISKIGSYFDKGLEFTSADQVDAEINKITGDMISPSPWLKRYFNNGFIKAKLSFSIHEEDFSTFEPVKSILHYPENCYLNGVKNKLA